MELKLFQLNCPGCGAVLDCEDHLDVFFCKYCGQRIVLDDRFRREAKIREQEIRLKKASHEDQIRLEYAKLDHDSKNRQETSRHLWRAAVLVLTLLLMAGGILYLFHYTEIPAMVGRKIDSQFNMIEVTASSDSFPGKNYHDVVQSFTDAGFTNVTTRPIEDLIFGFLIKDGAVDQVYINGQFEFQQGDKFSRDAAVVITYHTLPS